MLSIESCSPARPDARPQGIPSCKDTEVQGCRESASNADRVTLHLPVPVPSTPWVDVNDGHIRGMAVTNNQ